MLWWLAELRFWVPLLLVKEQKSGAGSVVLKEVPPYATVVGIPGHVVAERGNRVHHHDESDVELNHNKLPDLIEEQIGKL